MSAQPSLGPSLLELVQQLQQQQWAREPLERLLVQMQQQQLDAADRLYCLQHLRQYWQHNSDTMTVAMLHSLYNLAWLWSDDLLALQLNAALHAHDSAAYRLGYEIDSIGLYSRLGDWDLAQQQCCRCLWQQPHNAQAQAYQQQLQHWQWLGEQKGVPTMIDPDPRLSPIYLQLLRPEHIDHFFWQYAAQDIAPLCCLPQYASAQHWQQWLDDELDDPHRYTLAICHQHWGLIGVVSLLLYQGLGLVYYWLGADFRGQGYTAQAVQHLLAYAQQHWGLQACYAKTFCDNIASQALLQRLGFCALPIAIIDLQQSCKPEYLYGWHTPATNTAVRQQVNELLWQMGTTIRVVQG